MELLIVASGKIKDFDLTPYIPVGTRLILFDGSKKLDTLLQKYLISKFVFKPNYRRYKFSAPRKRDEYIIQRADRILILQNRNSRKIERTINYAKKINKPLTIVALQDK